MPGPLDGGTEGPLVLGAHPALPARFNLGPVGNVPAQALVVLVVDVLDVFHAEGTDSTSGSIPATGPPTGAGAAGRPGAALLVASGTSGAWPGAALSCRSGTAGRGLCRG